MVLLWKIVKENKIQLKLVRILYNLKLFNFYIMEENKLNEFREAYKIIY